MESLMSSEVELLKVLYARFSTRDIEAVLASMHEDVIWANGMEGGHVHGRDGVLADQMVGHIFQIENGLVRRFDIRGA
jgi:hypothetical protein